MTPAAHALLDGLIDYAGLFPPAALDLAPAADAYARHRRSPEAWMLGPVHRPGRPPGRPRRRGRPTRARRPLARVGAGARRRARRLARVGPAHARPAPGPERARPDLVCDRFEIKLPADLARDPDALAGTLADLDRAYTDGGAAGPRAALEVPFLDAPDAVAPAAQAVADANGRAGRPAFALKFRCGGVTPDLVPDVETLAPALADALRAGAPFKATAGLHHPLPNDDDAVGARMHGFLGVFGGAALARVHGLGPGRLGRDLARRRTPAAWSVGDDLRWRSLRATPAEVADARQQAALSFGSCSFDEPLDDLARSAGLARGRLSSGPSIRSLDVSSPDR